MCEDAVKKLIGQCLTMINGSECPNEAKLGYVQSHLSTMHWLMFGEYPEGFSAIGFRKKSSTED